MDELEALEAKTENLSDRCEQLVDDGDKALNDLYNAAKEAGADEDTLQDFKDYILE
jgi:hypothetical protein